jgi:hypothetical protein
LRSRGRSEPRCEQNATTLEKRATNKRIALSNRSTATRNSSSVCARKTRQAESTLAATFFIAHDFRAAAGNID